MGAEARSAFLGGRIRLAPRSMNPRNKQTDEGDVA
jgi:hypothetical protein